MATIDQLTIKFVADVADLISGADDAQEAIADVGDETEKMSQKSKSSLSSILPSWDDIAEAAAAAGNMLALKWADERLYNLNLQIAIQEMIIERYSALHKLYSSCVNARLSQKDAAVEIALHRKRGAEILEPNFDALELLKREREDYINDPLWDVLGRKPKAEIIPSIAKPDMAAMFRLDE